MSKLKGAIKIKAGSKTFTLKFSTNAMVAYEDETGQPFTSVMEHFQAAEQGRVAIKVMRQIFKAGLVDQHPETTLEEAGEIIDRVGFTEAMNAVGEAVLLAFPEPEDKPVRGEVLDKPAGKAKPVSKG